MASAVELVKMWQSETIPPFREIRIPGVAVPPELSHANQITRLRERVTSVLAFPNLIVPKALSRLSTIIKECNSMDQLTTLGSIVVDRFQSGAIHPRDGYQLFLGLSEYYIGTNRRYMDQCLIYLLTSRLSVISQNGMSRQGDPVDETIELASDLDHLLGVMAEIYQQYPDPRGAVHTFVARYLNTQTLFLQANVLAQRDAVSEQDRSALSATNYLLGTALRAFVSRCLDQIQSHQAGPLPLALVVQRLEGIVLE